MESLRRGFPPPHLIMKYYTSIEWLFEHDDFMSCSKVITDKEKKYTVKTGKQVTDKVKWRIINTQIKKKINNSKSVEGVCNCNSDILCKHRKKYLKGVLSGN